MVLLCQPGSIAGAPAQEAEDIMGLRSEGEMGEMKQLDCSHDVATG